MDYFSRKSLSKYLINTIDFNKRNIEIFINDTRQKYADDYSKLQGDFMFDPTRKQTQPSQGNFFC